MILTKRWEPFFLELSDILIDGIMGRPEAQAAELFLKVKQEAKKMGILVNTFESPLKWEDMKLNEDGLLPVVVQDHKNLEILMVGYMNQEAFEETLATGRMTYYSRSRKELWIKGNDLRPFPVCEKAHDRL